MENFRDRVLAIVGSIPVGQVTTYGRIAARAGSLRSARIVGGVLSHMPADHDYPCHRVVNRDGRLTGAWSFGHPDVMRHLLEAEGVVFREDGSVDLERHLWEPE